MFFKLFTLFAVLAMAFAAPKPEPAPQIFTYSSGVDYVYPAAAVPSVVSAYSAPYAPLTYSAYPNAYFVRK